MLRKCFYTILSSSFLFLIGINQKAWAQCPNIGISIGSNACVGDTIVGAVYSTYETYAWDMSFGDIAETPTATNLGNIGSALTNPRNITIVEDQGEWFGFINNFSASVIYRLYFGNSLENTPTLDTVSFTPTASNGGNTECKIRFLKEGGNWYGLQVTDQERLLVHQFGNALTNNNLTTNVYVNPFGLFSDPKDLVIVSQNDSVFAIVINRSTEDISVIEFGTSIANAPISGFNESIIEDSSYLNNSACLEVKRYCGDWLVFVASATTDNIVRLNFGAHFNSTPTGDMLLSSGTLANPRSLEIFEEANQYYGLVKGNQGPGLTLLTFGSDLTSTPSAADYTNFGGLTNGTQALSVEVVNDSSRWYAFVTNAQNNNERIVRLDYPNDDNTAIWSDSTTLSFIATSPGTQHVSFIGRDSAGNIFFGQDSIEVFPSPTVQFDYDVLCDNKSTAFSDQSASVDSITSWHWDFGTGDTSNVQDPNYAFPDSGEVVVSLSVTTANQCTSSYDSLLYVYKAPNAQFTADSVCQLASTVIVESSQAYVDTLQSWVWRFASDTFYGQYPEIQFDSVGWNAIELDVETSSGCHDTLNVLTYVSPSPISNFDIGSTCLGDTTSFINLSVFDSGSMSFSWVFGDGNGSTETNPNNAYSLIGSYNAQLNVVGSNGCLDSSALEVTVSVPPVVSIGVLDSITCSRTEIGFEDNSTVSVGSIIAWEWDFGQGDSSIAQDPSHTFVNHGPAKVRLRTYSGTKCSQMDSIELDILESPMVTFSAEATCTDQSTVFQSTSTPGSGDTLVGWNWQIGSLGALSGESASFTFDQTGIVPIELEVSTAQGCVQKMDSSIQIIGSPTIEIQGLGNQYCTNLELNFNAETTTSASDSIILFDWVLLANGVKVDSAYTPSFTSAQPDDATYIVIASASSAIGCSAVDSSAFILYESPTSIIQFNTACVGDTTYFTNNYSGSNYTYRWQFGDGLESAADDPVHIYADSGLYAGTFKITDNLSGCFDSDSMKVMVNPRPIPAFQSSPICAKSMVEFEDATLLENDSIIAANWDFIGIESNSAFAPSIYFESEGEVLLRYQIRTANNCNASSTEVIEVAAAPVLDFSIDPPYGSAPLQTTFNLSSEDSLDYFWVVNQDTVYEDEYIFNTNNNHSVLLVAERTDGCALSLAKSLLVDDITVDLAIRDLQVTFKDDAASFSASVANLGNIAIDDIRLRVSLNQSEHYLEPLNLSLEPGEERVIPLQGTLELEERDFEIACAQLVFDQDSIDANLENNSICVSDQSKTIISKPYPNPTDGRLRFSVVSPTTSNKIEYAIYDSKGMLKLYAPTSNWTGSYRDVDIDISEFNTGLYILYIKTEDVSFGFKVIKY